MRYFDLTDELSIPGRWHLGDVMRGGDSMKVKLESRRPVADGPVDVMVTDKGRSLDFSLTAYNVPIASDRLALAIALVAGADLQRLPAVIGGRRGYEVLHCTHLVDCLDEGRTEFTKWTKDDFRPDKAGEYHIVRGLTVDTDRIPPDAHFFRIAGWAVALIVSEELKAAMEHAGCLGARFADVSP
jgi:hypothetical protein